MCRLLRPQNVLITIQSQTVAVNDNKKIYWIRSFGKDIDSICVCKTLRSKFTPNDSNFKRWLYSNVLLNIAHLSVSRSEAAFSEGCELPSRKEIDRLNSAWCFFSWTANSFNFFYVSTEYRVQRRNFMTHVWFMGRM